MANANVLEQKKALVADLTEKLKGAASGVLVDYKGITVEQDTKLRAEMRAAGIDYAVVKNTLLRFAVNSCGYEDLDPLLNGTTSIAISQEDSIAPSRIVDQFVTKNPGVSLSIKGGFVEGRIMTPAELKAIAAIPSKEALIAQVLGTLLAPISSLAFVLQQAAEKGGAPAVAEAPAEEAAPAAEEAPVEAAPAEETPAAEAPTEEPTAE